MEKLKDERRDEEKALLAFLERTAEGKYAQIEESSLPYVRIKEEKEYIELEEEYFYSIN